MEPKETHGNLSGNEPLLDALDVELIKELEVDARQRYLDLASKLNTSPTTVSRRLQKLLDENIIGIVAMPDPAACGYPVRAGVGINTHPGQTGQAIDHLDSLQPIKYILRTAGRYDITAWGIFKSSDEVMNLLSDLLPTVPGIARFELIPVIRITKSSWKYFGDEPEHVQQPIGEKRLTKLDRSLIRLLEQDPRQTVSRLAAEVGLSVATTAKNLQRLMNQGLVRVVSVADRSRLGYPIWATLFIRVRADSIGGVADALACYEQVKHVTIIAGNFNIMAWGAFRGLKELAEFTDGQLGAIDGITQYEILLNLAGEKYSFSVLTDGASHAENRMTTK